MNSKRYLLMAILAMLVTQASAQKERPPYISPKEPEVLETLHEWQDWKFGMFIHWGAYSQWGIVESWSICPEHYEWIYKPRKGKPYFEYVKEYEGLKNTFNPAAFDPSQWAEAARYAGMKYVVFTTKHHDGFNMFDTKYSSYKISDKECPYHTNPNANVAKALFDAFRAEGLNAGAYFSICDWNHPDFWTKEFAPLSRHINYPHEKFPEKLQRFENFVNNQLDELTNGDYGKIDLMWFDLAGIGAPLNWDRFAKTLRSNQPGIMMVARHQNSIYENYRTPEQNIPDETYDYPWETCLTMAGSWSYKPDDIYKPTRLLLETLVQIVSRGGNLLLNVGPGPDGQLAPEAYKRMREIGDWMRVNDEGIYGTRPVAPYREGNIRFTQKDGYVYVFYVSGEDEKKIPEKVFVRSLQPEKGSEVWLMGTNKPLKWTLNGPGFYIDIPESIRKAPPCQHVWGFKIKINS
ncbi:MAG: alpha-L-fucosidase [Mangrovibacterium sp.]